MMAQQVEPMDVDDISEFDNKENSLHHNVPPHTEKGYEELDVSELNMKLRYSMTPVSSPMSKSYTANRSQDCDLNNTIQDNGNSKSLDSTMTESLKTQKLLPLQALPTDLFMDSTQHLSVLRPLDGTVTIDSESNANVTVTVTNDSDENISSPSTSSSPSHTPEATTPVKDIPKQSGSPIIRGLKSVLSMFRPSQSPIEDDDVTPLAGQEIIAPNEDMLSTTSADVHSRSQSMLASTPLANKHDMNSKRESLVFNDDLEKELMWKDETTIIFSKEKIPMHKLFYKQSSEGITALKNELNVAEEINQFNTVEPMDISYNNSMLGDKTMTVNQTNTESDASVFLDCESTINETKLLETTMEGDNSIEARKLECDVTVDISNTTVGADLSQDSDITRHNETNLSMKFAEISTAEENESVNKTANTTVNIAGSERSSIVASPVNEKPQIAELVASSALNVIKALTLPENASEVQPVIAVCNKEIETVHLAEDNTQDYLLKNNQALHKVIDEVKEEVIEGINQMADVAHPDTNLNTEDTIDLTVQKVRQVAINHVKTKPKLDDSVKESSAQAQIGPVLTTAENNGVVSYKTVLYVAENVPLPDENENFDSIEFTETSSSPFIGAEDKHQVVQVNHRVFNTTNDVAKDVSLDNLVSKATDLHGSGDMVVDKISTVAKQLEESLNELNASVDLTPVDGPAITISESEVIADKQEAPVKKPEENLLSVSQHVPTECAGLENHTLISTEIVENEQLDNSLALTNESIHAIPMMDVVPPVNITAAFESTETTELPNIESHENLDDLQVAIVDEAPVNKSEEILLSVSQHLLTECAGLENHTLIRTEIVENEQLDNSLAQTNESIHAIPMMDVVPPVNITAAFKSTETTELPNIKSHEKLDDVQVEIVDEAPVNKLEENLLSFSQHPTECAGLENHTLISAEIVENEQLDNSLAQTNESILAIPMMDVVPPVNITATFKSTETSELPNIESHENLDDIQVEIVDEDEELLFSENNSPYVFVNNHSGDIPLPKVPEPDVIETENLFATNTKIRISPPLSPKLPGKGYNLNFDDIEDPFASKTKMRLSPPLGKITAENTNVDVDALSNPTNYVTLDNTAKHDISGSLIKESSLNYTPSVGQTMQNVPDITTIIKKLTDKVIENADKTNTASEDNVLLDKLDVTADQAIKTLDVIENSQTAVNMTDLTVVSEELQDSNSSETFGTTPVKENINTFEINITQNKNLEVNQSQSSGVQDIAAESETKIDTDSPQSKLDDLIQYEENRIKDGDALVPEQMISIGSMTCGQDLTETSSSEQSVYLSAGTSSGESVPVLPVIDDDNPFAARSKMRQSPPLETYQENPFATKSKMASSPERTLQTTSTIGPMKEDHYIKEELGVDNKTFDTSKLETKSNESKDTCSESSKATDENDITTREVHTEDEDTMEGPLIDKELENCEDKISGIPVEKLDFNHFTELPVQSHEENISEEAGEMFIDADAFEFLMNQNQSSTVADSGKESLFLKFDPLFAKRVNSDGVVDSLSKMKRHQSTPKKIKRPPVPKDLIFMGNSPVAGPSHVSEDKVSVDVSEELNVTVSLKPTMAVPPAINPVVTPRMKVTTPTTPTRPNRLSMTFTSPAMAVIDRLLSLSANNSHPSPDTTLPHTTAEQNEADHALLQLRELLAEKELNVHHLSCETKELKDRLFILESQVSDLETESEKRLKNINELNQKLSERNNLNKKMASVVEEYERTIAGLIAGLEEDKKNHAEERDQLIKERDEQSAHLATMEVSFNDLHSKYEKTKQLIFSYKAREDTYNKSIGEFEENLKNMQNKYDQLKQHATSKLNHANQELEKINKGHEAEVLKMNAMIKRKDLHISSLEETLAQKTKANEELASICDELINKVG